MEKWVIENKVLVAVEEEDFLNFPQIISMVEMLKGTSFKIRFN